MPPFSGAPTDVLHVHNVYPLLSPWVVRTARRSGVPVVQTVHNYRHGCVAGTRFRDGAPCDDCLSTRTHWPAVAHACYRGSSLQSAVMASALTVHRHTWDGVDRFLAISAQIAEHLRQQGVPAHRITVRPNAVPDPGRHDESGDGLLLVGRLTEEKGVRLLLAAWKHHPDGALGQLRVVGDGPLRGLVVAATEERSDVEYLGRMEPAAVQQEMRRAAAVVVPSRWSEPFGLVAVEALANARPVLATASGALPSLVGPAGWVVAADEEALAGVLARVRSEAPGLAALARGRYESEFSPDVSLRQLLDVYAAVTARGDDRERSTAS